MPVVDVVDPVDLIPFDAGRSGPLYVILADAIASAIRDEHFHSGDALPPQRELAQRLDVSLVTVRKAIDRLEKQGLVIKKQGAGTFIHALSEGELHKPLSVLNGFSEDTRARGMVPSSEVISAGIYVANAKEVMALNLKPGDRISRLVRIRLGDSQPLAVETSTFPLDVLPAPQQVTDSVYVVLQQRNLRPVRALQSISARNADAEVAAQLAIAPRDAVLYVERQGLLENNRVVEYTTSYYRSDKYDFVTEITN